MQHPQPPTSAAPVRLRIGAGAFHRAHQAFYLDRLTHVKPDSTGAEAALLVSGGRALNASHALLAWRGAARRLDYIHECVGTPELREAMVRYVTDDVFPCLAGGPVDLPAYRDLIVDRFRNPHIRDTVARVAADGYAKVPGWVTPTLRERLDACASPRATAAIATAFLAFLRVWQDGGLGFDYADQGLRCEAVREMLAAPDPLASFAGDAELWGSLAARADLVELLREVAAGG